MVCNNFQVLVAKRKITAEKVAEATGVSQSTLSKFVNDKTDVKLSTLLKLCDFFKCDLSELIQYSPKRSEE